MLKQSRNRSFSMTKAGLLSLLIVTGHWLGESLHAAPLDKAQIETTFPKGMFAAKRKHSFDHTALFDADGTILLSGPLGEFEGDWWTFRDELCVLFKFGPAAGQTCASVERIGSQTYAIGDVVKLSRIASAVLIED